MKWTLIAMCAMIVTAYPPTGGTLGWGQDEKAKVVTPPAGLDVRNIEATALHLCKLILQQDALLNEASRTGNYSKYNEAQERIARDLKGWNGTEVKWLVQVNTVGGPFKGEKSSIDIITEYAYKNKSKLYIMNQDVSPLMRLRNNGEITPDMEFDEQWAKTLKRGDYIEMTGIIKNVHAPASVGRPEVHIFVTTYKKYVQPKRK